MRRVSSRHDSVCSARRRARAHGTPLASTPPPLLSRHTPRLRRRQRAHLMMASSRELRMTCLSSALIGHGAPDKTCARRQQQRGGNSMHNHEPPAAATATAAAAPTTA
jgi:hypothetical protein